jgi:hypothetical protein
MNPEEKRQILLSWIKDLDYAAIDALFNDYIDLEDEYEEHNYEAFSNIAD